MEKFTVKFDNEEMLNYLERLYVDVSAKRNIITSIFDLHKYDSDGAVISGKPFQIFMEEYVALKFEYDNVMKEVQNAYIPADLQEKGCNWEVEFDTKEIVITPFN